MNNTQMPSNETKSVSVQEDLQQFFYNRQERIDYTASEQYNTAQDRFYELYESLRAAIPEPAQEILHKLEASKADIASATESLAYKKGFEDAMQFMTRFFTTGKVL